jgi:hypothetical protein
MEWATDNQKGPVALVYEHGQPNSGFIKGILDAMMNFDNSIAGTTIARKKEFLALQAADFLANSYTHPDPYWFNQLDAPGRVAHRYITPDKIELLAGHAKRLFAESKRDRKKKSPPR